MGAGGELPFGMHRPDPWVEPPPGSIPVYKVGSIPTPIANGVETVVLTFTVLDGYDGTLLGNMNMYTDTSLVQGSGDLIWVIRINGRPAWDYGNITTEIGSVQEFGVIYGAGILLRSKEIVTYSVIHSLGSLLPPGPATRIVVGVKGYYWPLTGEGIYQR